MKLYQSLFLSIITLIIVVNATVVNADKAQTSATKKRKKTTEKIKFEDVKSKKHGEVGYSDGLQSYPGKTTYPANTQALPTTWTSHMGNEW